MEFDININNQNKHWILVVLGKIKEFVLFVWSVIVRVVFLTGRLLKRACKALAGLAALVIIIAAGVWGYDYYTNTYLPEKLLNDAVADITNKYESCKESEKCDLANHLLKTDYNFGYKDVSDDEIRRRLNGLRKQAFNYIEEQAYAGKAECQYILGQLYYHENDYISNDEVKAAYWWNEAANQGHTSAINNIGIAYLDGIGVAVDQRKAIEWLKKGAEAGEGLAQKNYGDLFVKGIRIKVGTHKETRQTADYYFGSNNNIVRQYFDSNCNTVTVYKVDVDDYDQLIPQDIEQAKYWWKKAAAQGNEDAKEALQQIYD